MTVRQLRPHGTRAAYKAHRRRREVACQMCCDAEAEYQRARRSARRTADAETKGEFVMPRVLKPCGTMAAARRHWRRGEQPCAACREAELEYQRARKGSKPFRPAVCGTVGGYRRHLDHGERPCLECRAANAKNMREYKARRAAASEGGVT